MKNPNLASAAVRNLRDAVRSVQAQANDAENTELIKVQRILAALQEVIELQELDRADKYS